MYYIARNELTERGLFKHEGYNVCGQCYESLYSPRVLYCKMIWYLIECRIIPGVWSSSWHGDTGWEEEKAGQGAGGEGEEDEGLASTEKL